MLALCQLVYRDGEVSAAHREGRADAGARRSTLATGSCRDMATLMMEAAAAVAAWRRASPAATCTARASMAGHASTHAWTEVYLPTLGWRGFDPTHRRRHRRCNHIVTGVSSHPRGVMPVSGTFTGEPATISG